MAAVRTRAMRAGQRIRVLVVDDSVVIRRLVCHVLEEVPDVEVVGVASNGAIALNRIPQTNPDVITLDIEMPEMDGLEMLRRLRREYPAIRVVMFSTLTGRGASATLEALTLGADDYVTKASNAGSLDVSLSSLRQELIPKLRQFFSFPGKADPIAPAPATVWPGGPRTAPRAVGIAVSTGGPAALGVLVPQFPADFPLPIFIVQHMPPLFTRLLAERLNATSRVRVVEATAGERPHNGTVYVAPGDFHLTVGVTGGEIETRLDQAAPQNSCRPSADALFESMAEVYGGAVIAAVLTGMGRDGMRGTRILKAAGAQVLAQDEATSVVWGMPGAVVEAGTADEVVPLGAIEAAIRRRV
jgi:two-component system chemotaxis response regulator CheB